MSDIFRPFNVISLAIGLLGLAWGIYTFYATKQLASISYTKISKAIFEDSTGRFKLIGSKDNTPESTKFLSLTRVAFWNSGSVPISANDVRRPFEISFSSGSRIIEWSLQRSYPEIAGFSLSGDNRSIQLHWKYFDPGFGGVIDIYQTGTAKDEALF